MAGVEPASERALARFLQD